MQRGQLGRMVLLEAVIQGAATAVLAVVLGGVLGWWLIAKSLPTTLGWVLNIVAVEDDGGDVRDGGGGRGGRGGYPAWRAARIGVVEAWVSSDGGGAFPRALLTT